MNKNLNVQFVPVYGYWVVYEEIETGTMWEQPVVAMGNTDEDQEEMSAVFYTLDGDGEITPVLDSSSSHLNVTLLYESEYSAWQVAINTSISRDNAPKEVIIGRAYRYHNGYGEEGKRSKEEYNKIIEEWEKRKGANVESSRD